MTAARLEWLAAVALAVLVGSYSASLSEGADEAWTDFRVAAPESPSEGVVAEPAVAAPRPQIVGHRLLRVIVAAENDQADASASTPLWRPTTRMSALARRAWSPTPAEPDFGLPKALQTRTSNRTATEPQLIQVTYQRVAKATP